MPLRQPFNKIAQSLWSIDRLGRLAFRQGPSYLPFYMLLLPAVILPLSKNVFSCGFI